MLDLPDLLDVERIRCRCELRSRKRTLQTLAELLGASLRGDPPASDAQEDGDDAEGERGGDDPVATIAAGADDAPAPISDMDILDALIARERLGSTGLGHGVALPHSRMPGLDEPLAALVTLREGVDFESADGEPVDLVVGLLVPEDCNEEHLKILADLARRFSDAGLRRDLRECEDAAALLGRLAASPTPH